MANGTFGSGRPRRCRTSKLPAFLCAVVASIVIPASAFADYLTARQAVALRAEPRAASASDGRAEAGQILPLVSPAAVNGFYQVSIGGKTHWIYRAFVSRHAGAPPIAASPELGNLEIHVINVGQGDAILIRCPDGQHQMLIDSGDTRYPGASEAFKAALTKLQPKSDPIEVVIATHPHADHIGNMEWLLRQYEVGLYVDDGVPSTTATHKGIEQAINDRHVLRERARAAGTGADFCPLVQLSAAILCPPAFGTLRDPNDNSVIVRLDYGSNSFLFVGDAEQKEEQQLLGDAAIRPKLHCDFLKLGHHGSDTSSSKAFLDAVSPRIAMISAGLPEVGTNVGYKHPRQSTVARVLQYVDPLPGAPRTLKTYDASTKSWTRVSMTGALYSTSLEGNLLVESDGTTIHVRPDP